jgi:hypothetical protein
MAMTKWIATSLSPWITLTVSILLCVITYINIAQYTQSNTAKFFIINIYWTHYTTLQDTLLYTTGHTTLHYRTH